MFRLFVIPFCAALVLGAPGQSASDEKRAAFNEKLDRVQRLVDGGRFGKAASELTGLLEGHEKAAYARGQRTLIENLITRAKFGERMGKIEPESVVGGKLKSWNARRGKIEIHYEVPHAKDFTRQDTLRIHNATFTGAYEVEFLIDEYSAGGQPATILVGLNAETAYRISFGRRPGKDGGDAYPAVLERLRGNGGFDKLDEVESSPLVPGKPAKLLVRLKEKSIEARVNGRRILSARREKHHFGTFTWPRGVQVKRLELSGTIEPAWLQGLVDEALAERRASFDKEFDVKQELPAWLYTKRGPKNLAKMPPTHPIPGLKNASDEGHQRYSAIDRLIDGEHFTAARRLLAKTKASALPPATKAYLEALIEVARGRHDIAVVSARTCLDLEPNSVLARITVARAEGGLGDAKAAWKTYQPLIKTYPGDDFLWTEAAEWFIRVADLDGLTPLLEAADATGIQSKALDQIRRMRVRARTGPDWPKRYETTSKHYHVITDIDRATAVKAADFLEQSYLAFIQRLERPSASKTRFKVFLFSGKAGYDAFCEDLFGQSVEFSAGLYSSTLKILLIWNLDRRDDMLSTVRHEGFHQYLDRVMPAPPIWFNEGLAEYFEETRQVNGRWNWGEVRKGHLRTLANSTTPLEDFFYMPQRRFMARAQQNYAQGWAVIHFLRHGPKEYRPLFDRMWDAFSKHPLASSGMDAALEGTDLDRLDRDFRAYLRRGCKVD